MEMPCCCVLEQEKPPNVIEQVERSVFKSVKAIFAQFGNLKSRHDFGDWGFSCTGAGDERSSIPHNA